MRKPVLLLPLLTLLAGAAQAADGNAILTKVDEALNASEDMSYTFDVVNMEPGQPPKAMQLLVTVKDELRMTEFTMPPDMKGTRALVQGQDKMYIYLPAYNKVRRISSSLTEGGFMGTTFSNEDFSTTHYAPFYDSQLTSEGDTELVLDLTPKEGVKVGYSKIEVTVDRKTMLPKVLKYFNKKGKHAKTETRTRFSCQGAVCTAGEMQMVDHLRGDASTTLIIVDGTWQVNQGVDDDLFSVRNLQK
jgi:outer membrane lipoprotein-sorting protein